MDLRGVEQFVVEIVFARTAKATAHHFTVGPSDHQAAGHLQEVSRRVAFELPPQLV